MSQSAPSPPVTAAAALDASPPPRRVTSRDLAVIALPAALAAVTSLIAITGRSLGFDEGATVAIVSQHGHALGAALARDGGSMLGYYLLMHVLVGAFGDGLLVLRLPSAVFTVATVAVVGAIGLRLFDRRVAAIAGVLSALSLPLVYWGQTARGYAPMVAFTCAGMLAFIALVEPAHGRGRPARSRAWAWAGYVVAMVLACYCSFVAVLVVPVQLLAVARRPQAARRLLGALAALAACDIPLAVLAVRRGSGQLFWVPHLGSQVDSQVMQSLTSAGLQPSFHRVLTTTVGWVVVALGLIAICAAALRAQWVARSVSDDRDGDGAAWAAGGSRAAGGGEPPVLGTWGAGTILAWVVVPGALAFVYSLISQPVFTPRNLLISVPAVALALALGITDRRLPGWAALGALVVALALRAVPLAASYGVSPEPWRAATADVLAGARAGDCIAFYPEDARNAFRYYVARDGAVGRAPRAILPAVPWSTREPFVERYATLPAATIARDRPGCRRMWIVSSHAGQLHGPVQSRRNRARYRRVQARLQVVFGPGPTTTYGYASAIYVQLLPGGRVRR